MSSTALQIQTLILSVASQPVDEVITNMLDGRSEDEAYDILKAMLSTGIEHDEQVSEIIRAAWFKLLGTGCWRSFFPDEHTLRTTFQYNKAIKPAIDRLAKRDRNIMASIRAITTRWRIPLQDLFLPELRPTTWSRPVTRALATLASQVPNRVAAVTIIGQANEERIKSRPSNSKQKTCITLADIIAASQQLAAGALSLDQPEARLAVTDQADEQPTIAQAADPSTDNEEVGSSAGQTVVRTSPIVLIRTGLGQPDLPVTTCLRCDPSCSVLVPQIPSRKVNDETAMRVLLHAVKIGIDKFCKPHLRRIAGYCGGLYNNKDSHSGLLVKRIVQLAKNKDNLMRVKIAHPDWFRRDVAVPALQTNPLGPFRYAPKPATLFRFNAEQVFNRYAQDMQAWTQFQHDGTINLDGFFSYLVDNPEVFAIVEEEFNMYKYHLRTELDGQDNRGWMRHMFYSLPQQVIRQDPGYWAMTAAARPDTNYWLISYPYYVKDTSEGENTGFAHFDINVDEFVKSGRGLNMVQGSVSVDDEMEDNCTLLVLGFQHVIHEWWGRVTARGKATSGHTTNAKNIYMPEDRQSFGQLVPVPCKRGAIRITRPDIMHSSTSKANSRRRTLFAWFCGIRADHQTLDLKESETWSEVSACHQSFTAPMKSTSGEGFRYGRPIIPFPATTRMASTSPIGDALVGSKRWTDPQVTRMVEILLGPNDEAALALLESVRNSLSKAIKDAWPFVREAEIKAFGNKSYFANQGRQQPPADGNPNVPPPEPLSDSEDSEDSFGEGAAGGDELDGEEIEVSDADAEYEMDEEYSEM
ncbi:MAG: hypothetical protein M1840_007305 [Geoglossum simile]|nr:MAG: hypothetical protein M1840_007305 [Geoglossum simile]